MILPNELVKIVSTGDCILFLGAGIHAPPPENADERYPLDQRPPLGRELARRLAEDSGFAQRFPEEIGDDLMRVSLFIETEAHLGRKHLVDCLRRELQARKPSHAVRMLAALPFKIIVTTNFDNMLETALRDANKDPFKIVYDPSPDTPTKDMHEDPTSQRPLLFKMHGDLEEQRSIVITDEDYITFVQRMSDKPNVHPVPETVRYRMARWRTIFLGYSLRDYNLRLLFRTLRWRMDRADIPVAFAVDKYPDPLILKVWQDERKFIAFVVEDLWSVVPELSRRVNGQQAVQ